MFLPKSDNNNSYCETKRKNIADKFTFFHVVAESSKLWIYGLNRVSHFFKVIEISKKSSPLRFFLYQQTK